MPEQFMRVLIPIGVVAAIHLVTGLVFALKRGTPRLSAIGLGADLLLIAGALLLLPPETRLPLAFLLLVPVAAFAWRYGVGAALVAALVALAGGGVGLFLGSGDGASLRDLAVPLGTLFAGLVTLALMIPGLGSNASATGGETKIADDPHVQEVFMRLSRVLSQEMNSSRVLQALLDLGAEVLLPQKPASVQGMALIFGPESRDRLRVAAWLRLSTSTTSLPDQGVFHEILTSGEGAIASSEQSPLDMVRDLNGKEVVLWPLRTALDVYGLVFFSSIQELGLDREGDQRPELLQALVNHCSLALQNTLLQDEVRQDRNEILLSEEESRHKLARDLHDGPIQRVAAIVMQLEFIKALLKRQPDRVMGEIDQAQATARQAAQEMRTLLFTLRPIVLEHEGLVAAVNQYVERLRDQERVNIKLESDEIPRFDPQVEEAIFAIVQEAAGNAKKHAGGALITVRLMTETNFLIAEVEDKGPGFDVNKTKAGYSARASLGMINMEERARMIDGRLNLNSAPGKGTTVSLAVPLPHRAFHN